MTPAQAYALAHPLDYAGISGARMEPYKTYRRHGTGILLQAVLAVDR